ncbi:MAG TPA: cytochrome P450 [Ktedonobacteraceae bacterium]|nr:cytochrome P450 [Ktedonobacteraceae bacterium]
MLQLLSTLNDVPELYRWFQHMRASQPVWLDESSGCWHVFRYDDVNRVTTDYQEFSSERRQRPFVRGGARSLIGMDPPQHRQYRNLVTSAFTPRAITSLSGRIQEIVQELLDQVRRSGHMDVVTEFAYPLPTIVIAEMLGVPTSDRPMFKRWADALLSRQLSDAQLFQEEEVDTPAYRQAQQAGDEMHDYFAQMLAERERQPRADMMTSLLQAEVEGARLSREDVISFCILLLIAGHVTTTNLLSQAILCFDAHAGVMDQLRAHPELMPNAIEEVLRYASPVWRITRVTRTTVDIGGVSIPPDVVIFAWLSSANRDETQFPDPERFDITRTPNRHLAFGHGIHFCIGAPLARLESSIALPMMLAQLTGLRVLRDKPLELLDSRVLFGVKHLPVAFTAGD